MTKSKAKSQHYLVRYFSKDSDKEKLLKTKTTKNSTLLENIIQLFKRSK